MRRRPAILQRPGGRVTFPSWPHFRHNENVQNDSLTLRMIERD